MGKRKSHRSNVVVNISLLLLFSFIVLSQINCLSAKPGYLKIANPDGTKLFKKSKEIYQDYALCSCLNYSLKKDSASFRDDSRETLYDLSYDYLSIGNAGKIIDSSVVVYVNSLNSNKGETYENRKSIFLSCIVYYKSKQLKSLINCIHKKD